MFSNRTVFSGVLDSVVADDCVFEPLIESSLSSKSLQRNVLMNNSPRNTFVNVRGVPVVETVWWRMKQMIFTHLTYPRILAVHVAIQLAFKTVVLNFCCCFTQILVDFFMTDGMFNFNACLAGTRTWRLMCEQKWKQKLYRRFQDLLETWFCRLLKGPNCCGLSTGFGLAELESGDEGLLVPANLNWLKLISVQDSERQAYLKHYFASSAECNS